MRWIKIVDFDALGELQYRRPRIRVTAATPEEERDFFHAEAGGHRGVALPFLAVRAEGGLTTRSAA